MGKKKYKPSKYLRRTCRNCGKVVKWRRAAGYEGVWCPHCGGRLV